MWKPLTIYHQKNSVHSKDLSGDFVWKTCQRTIQFLEPGVTVNSRFEFYSGIYAHQFLVEVCSGLHSPLVGETEVFGQFREFRKKANISEAWNHLLDAVEEDVKKIRRELLTSLGPQNYGSLIRKFLIPGETIVLVGAGHLAKELLPWLEEQKVFCLARDVKRADGMKCEVVVDPALLPAGAKWIIAAPISNEQLLRAWKSPSQVLDMRGENSLDLENYFSLNQLYAQLEASRFVAERQKQLALARVHELSQKRGLSSLHRPYGWEDMFA